MRVASSADYFNRCIMPQPNNPASWIEAMKKKHGINEVQWAEMAGVARSTITRAKTPGYEFTTKAVTLERLARAINETAPAFAGIKSGGLSAEALAAIVAEIIQAVAPGVRPSDDLLLPVAEALQDILAALAADPDAASDPAKSRAVARALMRRLGH